MPSSSHTSVRPTHSCVRCAARKVKCNRAQPCESCTRHSAECVYHPVQPRARRKRPNKQDLEDRLRQYESLLRDQGIEPKGLSATPTFESAAGSTLSGDTVSGDNLIPEPPASKTGAPISGTRKTKVIQGPGHTKIIDNILWAALEEHRDPQDILETSSNDEDDSEVSDEDFGFILDGASSPGATVQHPSQADILQLWQVYREYVDPLTKLVHIPTLAPVVERASRNLDSVPRSLEALMFSIYSAAIMSLKDDECRQRFSEPRSVLFPRYVNGAKVALSRARFMGTTNVTVLQALVVYLLATRDIYEPRAVWSLIGVAVRIAQGMGFEHDGTYLGLPPFETEMRRRIWWQLKTLDFRTGELCGVTKFHDLQVGGSSTKWPSNIGDDQLFPGMTALPAASRHMSDAVFISVKSEFLNCAAERATKLQNASPNASQLDLYCLTEADADRVALGVEERLESKYLRYCDPSQPLQLITMLMARCAVNVIRFMSHHPRRWINGEQASPSERQKVWDICLKLLEQHQMVLTNPLLRQFAWHAPYTHQWHVLIHVLDCLRVMDSDRAWDLIESTYTNSPHMYDMRRPIHVAVGNLCLKAYSKRESLQRGNGDSPPTPAFIVHLREQLHTLKAKRQRRAGKRTQSENPAGMGGADHPGTNAKTGLPSNSGLPHRTQEAQPLPPANPEPDQSLHMYGFGDDPPSNTSLDLGFLLDQDTPDCTSVHPIDWDKWDSWLASTSVAYPQLPSQ